MLTNSFVCILYQRCLKEKFHLALSATISLLSIYLYTADISTILTCSLCSVAVSFLFSPSPLSLHQSVLLPSVLFSYPLCVLRAPPKPGYVGGCRWLMVVAPSYDFLCLCRLGDALVEASLSCFFFIVQVIYA